MINDAIFINDQKKVKISLRFSLSNSFNKDIPTGVIYWYVEGTWGLVLPKNISLIFDYKWQHYTLCKQPYLCNENCRRFEIVQFYLGNLED